MPMVAVAQRVEAFGGVLQQAHDLASVEEFGMDREILEGAYEQQHKGDIQLEPKASI